ncbi:CoA-acylating methylmalonate-semialdehyde dehydrogenase [Vibrio breoganii]|uniref:CoA-acylating methylmalonate-semialdehyde dehydrogenase n=1 Tax=Vibrio breoganii TaxID=553239 RepID=UPI000C837114|nr:CoA-acylating methylmalonate-semialdehyde dehydrogenase [Vibrio breoganii]PMH14997.1 methylmalonate-semialdehyde dehydrogenase (acylating) [Vibrio breoganii]PMK18312.1 methylmalonate-semialdehyde dehydrogenase (acylating) [Vibrio breoganii]PML20190.1 methylmalonate-semialdehyde dehydrogenase (acylating) [Vibrio breoganii]PML38222.1 methylmalonate-semialdehyde dehydrogenase (acylating) [Vibrio breoganii]PML60409.1 methylmalonate-semialdehyde dehydrogenase (acylating) [Vibrio breoganii]
MSVLVSNFINGQTVASNSGRTADLFDPANGELRGQVQLSSAEEALATVDVAKQAQQAWQDTPPLQRARVMFRFKALLEENADELATLISTEHGKVHSDALGELTRGLEVVEFACGIPHLLKGEHSLNVGREIDSYSMMQPVGVCVGITPFNFPVMVPLWMIPVSLACGNSFILKPSEKDPSVSLMLADMLKKSGLPDGVFNVIQGDKEVVDALLEAPDVAAVSFVGSTPIAEAIYSKGSANGKRVQALGGAKNHLVVMPDADLEGATNALMGAAYGAAGERCMAISVAVAVGDETADRLVASLKEKVQTLRVGPGLGVSPENEMGPLVSEPHMNKVKEYIQTGVDQGATLVVDGRDINASAPGYFVGGTLFDNVTSDMTIYNEEIFGPVLCVVRAKDYQEALQLINQHEFGNGTAIYTRDGDTARDFSEKVEIGMVGVNVPIPVPMAFHSFGGWKRSIFGPLNVHGNDGVRFYTRMKTVTARWPKGQRESEFVMPTMK